MDVEQPPLDGGDHLAVEHQVPAVATRHEHALVAVQPGRGADPEIPLDLLVDAAHRQHLAVLVERSGHRQPLAERHPGERGEQDVEFRAGGGIPLDAVVLLLEDDGRVEGERRVAGEQRGQIVLEDEHTLVVDGPGHRHLALDTHQSLLAGVGAGGDARREAEAVVPQVDHGQAVHLADRLTVQADEHLALGDGLAHLLFRVVVPPGACGEGRVHVRRLDQPAVPHAAEGGALQDERLGAAEDGALPAPVLRLAMALFEQAGDRGRGEMRQAEPLAGAGNEHRRGAPGLVTGREPFGKVHLDAEAAGELGVRLLQIIIELA